MKIVQPITTTDTTLTSSNVLENDYAQWNVGTTYTIGTPVIVTTPNIHKIYESAASGNTGNDPVTDDGTWWTEISATNLWKMFDGKTGTQTERIGTIEVEITPGELFNSIAVLNMEADSLNVTVTDPTDGEVYNEDVDLLDLTDIVDFYEWYFNPLENITDVVLFDLPAYTAATVAVTVDTGLGTAAIGELIVGTLVTIGVSEYGTKIGIQDYSRKETDEEGNSSVLERAFAKTADFDILIDSNKVANVQRKLASYRATPVVYVGDENLQETIIYGFYKNFSIVLNNFNTSSCTIKVEELT